MTPKYFGKYNPRDRVKKAKEKATKTVAGFEQKKPTKRATAPGRKYEESTIQAATIQVLQAHDIYAIMVPNGEVQGMTAAKAARLMAMGFRSGVSDLILVQRETGKAAFLELKTRTGRQSEKQKDFEALCHKVGWDYGVARSAEEALALAKKWGF